VWGTALRRDRSDVGRERWSSRLKSCIASDPRFFEFQDEFQRPMVLPPAFFNWQCEISVDQTQIDSRPPASSIAASSSAFIIIVRPFLADFGAKSNLGLPHLAAPVPVIAL